MRCFPNELRGIHRRHSDPGDPARGGRLLARARRAGGSSPPTIGRPRILNQSGFGTVSSKSLVRQADPVRSAFDIVADVSLQALEDDPYQFYGWMRAEAPI